MYINKMYHKQRQYDRPWQAVIFLLVVELVGLLELCLFCLDLLFFILLLVGFGGADERLAVREVGE